MNYLLSEKDSLVNTYCEICLGSPQFILFIIWAERILGAWGEMG